MPRLATVAFVFALALASCGGGSGDKTTATSTAQARIETATELPPDVTPPAVSIPNVAPDTNISLPDGYSAYPIATGFFRPTSIAIASDGSVYVSERHGTVEHLSDADGDGVFETTERFVETSGEITGVLASPDGLYVSRTGALLLVRDTNGDGTGDSAEEIVADLPHGRHQNNGLALGPDGKLYLTNGTTCDDCNEDDERSGTILQANPDGSGLRVFATGLRNPYDLVFDPARGLWATDNGSDTPCETVDELNMIVDGFDYGWPYGEDGCDPYNDGIAPTASLGLHTASTGIDFYGASQFPGYRGALFMTLWGSFFAEPELEPQLLTFWTGVGDTTSRPADTSVHTFATGFVHPIDVAVDRDGTLLVLDYGVGGDNDTSGTLYRIIYTGG